MMMLMMPQLPTCSLTLPPHLPLLLAWRSLRYGGMQAPCGLPERLRDRAEIWLPADCLSACPVRLVAPVCSAADGSLPRLAQYPRAAQIALWHGTDQPRVSGQHERRRAHRTPRHDAWAAERG